MRKLPLVFIFILLFALAVIFSACAGETEAPTLTKITLDTSSLSTDYSVGDKIIPSQIKITVHKSNGFTESVACDSSMLSGADTSTPGEKTVKVTYQGLTASFTMLVGGIKRYEATDEGYIEGKATQKISYNGNGSRVVAMAYEGYQFSHWSDGLTSAERRDVNVTDFSTITANFKPASFTVTFVDQNGVMLDTKTLSYGEDALPFEYEREGFYISSYTVDGGRNLSSLKVRENLTVTVGFKAVEHTVTFEGGKDFSSKTFEYGENIIFPTPVSEVGKVFSGWADDKGNFYKEDFVIKGDLNLHAVYSFRVILKVGDESFSYLFNEGESFSIPEDIKAPQGCVIKGFEDEEGNPLDGSYLITKPKTFYAVLDVISYQISFLYPEEEKTVTVEYGQKLKLPADNPQLDGKTFLYWTKEGEAYDFSLPVTSNFSLAPKWEGVTVSVYYLEVVGQAEKIEKFEYGAVLGDLYTPQRAQPQYIFGGWFYDAQHKNPYQSGQVLTSDINLYAKWETKTFTPVFDVGEGGTYNLLSSSTIYYGGTMQFEVRASQGYHISEIFYGDTQMPVDEQTTIITKTITDITAQPTVRISFAPNTYTVFVESSPYGTASKTLPEEVLYQDTYSVTFTPITGYVLEKVLVNGISHTVPSNNFFTLKITKNTQITPIYALQKFAITFLGENYNVEGGEKVVYMQYGESRQLKLTAYTNFVISRIEVKGKEAVLPMAPEYTVKIDVITQDLEISVETKGDRVTLSCYINEGAGKIEENGQYLTNSSQLSVDFGDKRTIKFIPNEGFKVKDVVINGISRGGISTFEYTPLKRSGDKLEVYFELKKYDISIKAEANGKVTPSGISRLEHGGSITVTATPDEYYLVSSYRINSETFKVGLESFTLTLDNVTESKSIVFTFEVKKYNMSLAVNKGGNVIVGNNNTNTYFTDTQLDEYSISYGNTVNVRAEYGYHITSLKVDGTTLEMGYDNNATFYSLGIMYSNLDLEVSFAPNTYQVNGVVSEGGRIEVAEVATYGIPLEFKIIPDEGYYLTTFTVDGITQENNDVFTIPIVANDVVYSAQFEIYRYEVSVETSEGGTHDDYSSILDYGDSLYLSFKAEDHYYVTALSINGEVQSIFPNSKTFVVDIPKVTEDVKIKAEFSLETFEISLSYIGNGHVEIDNQTIESGRSYKVAYGDSPVCAFVADLGYEIESLIINGEEQSLNTSITLHQIDSNVSISLKFKVKTYSISVNPSSGGKVEISANTLAYGETLTLTVTPDAGYKVAWVKVNGRNVTLTNNVYTLTSINKNILITASFVKE